MKFNTIQKIRLFVKKLILMVVILEFSIQSFAGTDQGSWFKVFNEIKEPLVPSNDVFLGKSKFTGTEQLSRFSMNLVLDGNDGKPVGAGYPVPGHPGVFVTSLRVLKNVPANSDQLSNYRILGLRRLGSDSQILEFYNFAFLIEKSIVGRNSFAAFLARIKSSSAQTKLQRDLLQNKNVYTFILKSLELKPDNGIGLSFARIWSETVTYAFFKSEFGQRIFPENSGALVYAYTSDQDLLVGAVDCADAYDRYNSTPMVRVLKFPSLLLKTDLEDIDFEKIDKSVMPQCETNNSGNGGRDGGG